MTGYIAIIVLLVPFAVNAQYYNSTINGDSRGSPESEVDLAITPQPAKCMPELRTVKLRDSDDQTLHYVPSCTRVERCGGCCQPEEFLSCHPTEIEFVKFKVSVSKYISPTKYSSLGRKVITVERHLKCKCDCTVKAQDCNHLQIYVKHECKCLCTNMDEKRKCVQSGSKLKYWDLNDCVCQCLHVKDCTSGYVFNKHTCNCESEMRQRMGAY